MSDPTRDRDLIKLARSIERTAARRRKLLAQLRILDDQLRTERKFLRDLTTPSVEDVYAPTVYEDEP